MAGESFREGNNRGAAAGAATRVKLSCFAVAVGRLGTASRRAGTGSVAPFCPCTSSEAGGARIAAPVLKVGETALSQKREVKQGPPPHDAQHHPDNTPSRSSISKKYLPAPSAEVAAFLGVLPRTASPVPLRGDGGRGEPKQKAAYF